MHPDTAPRRRRADAQRNVGALIEAARTVFATSGVDAPAKEITDLAGVGVGTLYRHFPQRSDLVKAVVESGIDAVADAGPALSAAHEPAEALTQWIHRFTELLATKRGLASALHSGDPAFAGLPGYFLQRLGPTLAALLDAAVADGTVRDDLSAEDLLHALTQLSQPVPGRGPERNQHIVAVLIEISCAQRVRKRGNQDGSHSFGTHNHRNDRDAKNADRNPVRNVHYPSLPLSSAALHLTSKWQLKSNK